MNTLEDQNKIAAVIPFYNEKQHLKKVVDKTLKYVDSLILVNDGSNDGSENTLKANDKVIIINHKENLGKGAALKSGFIKSMEIKSELTITLDADLQHDPEYIPKLIQSVKNFDCIIGSRRNDYSAMPIERKLSNFITSKLLSFKTGVEILDSQSGYRIFKTSILKDILPLYNGFEAESEMIVKMSKNKYKIGFLDIPTIYGNDNTKMKAIPAILGFIKVILKS